MRKKLTISILGLFLISLNCLGQDDEILKGLLMVHDKIDCEVITLNAVDFIAENFNENLDSTKKVLSKWIEKCGISECSQRLVVLLAIIDNQNSTNAIEEYFNNNFYFKLINRYSDSEQNDFGYKYTRHKSYYEYVPLRHAIDSLVIKKSLELLKRNNLSSDEELACMLFSNQLEHLDKELKKKKYRESYIRNHIRKESFKQNNSWVAYNIYTGVIAPLSNKNNVYGYSPIIGLSFSSPMKNKLIVEIGVKFNILTNDKNFDYYAKGDTNTVDTDVGIFFGGLIGYKIFQNNDYTVIPKFGIGLGTLDTNLSKENSEDSDDNYYDVETIHLSLGISAMKAIMRKSYIGVALNYHYIPYNLDDDLITDISSNALSIELFFRF